MLGLAMAIAAGAGLPRRWESQWEKEREKSSRSAIDPALVGVGSAPLTT
jgi:hypothetical protein